MPEKPKKLWDLKAFSAAGSLTAGSLNVKDKQGTHEQASQKKNYNNKNTLWIIQVKTQY